MAIYSLHVSNVSRAAGSSAVASCSYITSRRMRDERTGEAFNGFGRRERVEHVCTMLPEARPASTSTRSVCSTPSRCRETFRREAREEDHGRPAPRVRRPRTLPRTGGLHFMEHHGQRYACTYAIHTDKDGRNPRAHPRRQPAHRPEDRQMGGEEPQRVRVGRQRPAHPVIDPDTGRQKIGARNRKVWKRVNVSNNPLDSKEFLRLRREWADSCNALLPGYAVIDHRSFKARGIERIPTIHEGYASREMEKRGGRGDLCEENRRIQALNRLLDALRAMIGQLSDQAQGILTAVKRRQRPSRRATGPFQA